MINEYNAYSLSDFMRIVSDIGRKMGTTPEKPPVLWIQQILDQIQKSENKM